MKILVADKLDQKSLAAVKGTGLELVDRAGISPEELLDVIAGFDALVVRSRTKVTPAVLAAGRLLRVVGRAGTGVDNIDLAEATRRGILVMNTPGANSNAAAEHTIALILALCRNVAAADGALRQGRFEPSAFTGVEVLDRVLALLGLGRIGMLVAKKAQGLGMRVIGHDPVVSPDVAKRAGIELMSIEDAVWHADVISLHMPLLASTRHLVDAELIAQMKQGARIVNCARGGLIDEAAALEALESGHLAGLALDVFEEEPPLGNPLLERADVVATPHLGASTVEAQETVGKMILTQVADYLCGRGAKGSINGLRIDDATRTIIGPYLNLAERLGRIMGASQSVSGRLTARYYGTVTTANTRALTSYFLKGFLSRFLGDEVSELNAFELARQRGMDIEEVQKDEHRSFATLLFFTLESEGKKESFAGTLFGKKGLRVVRCRGHNLDAIPEGHMLFVTNADRPGVVGALGTVLGGAGVNIANMSLSRNETLGEALAVLNIDSRPDDDVLARLRALDGVRDVRLVSVEDDA